MLEKMLDYVVRNSEFVFNKCFLLGGGLTISSVKQGCMEIATALPNKVFCVGL